MSTWEFFSQHEILKKIPFYETFLCGNFQKFETFISARGAAARARAGAPVCATCGGSGSVSTRTRSSSRRGVRRVPRQLSHGQQRGDVAHALVHDGTQLRELPERPVALQHEAKRARVCQVQERQRILPRRLQRIRKAAECSLGQLQLEAEQRQRRVACVEGSLAARAGEAQCVARHRLVAHAATQARGSAARGKACAGLPGAGTPADCAAPPPERQQGCRMRTGAAADRD